jgi:hypothetical protein
VEFQQLIRYLVSLAKESAILLHVETKELGVNKTSKVTGVTFWLHIPKASVLLKNLLFSV